MVHVHTHTHTKSLQHVKLHLQLEKYQYAQQEGVGKQHRKKDGQWKKRTSVSNSLKLLGMVGINSVFCS